VAGPVLQEAQEGRRSEIGAGDLGAAVKVSGRAGQPDLGRTPARGPHLLAAGEESLDERTVRDLSTTLTSAGSGSSAWRNAKGERLKQENGIAGGVAAGAPPQVRKSPSGSFKEPDGLGPCRPDSY
jgi:hypothetical protein